MLRQESLGFFMALVDDLSHFGIDRFTSGLAERLFASVTARAAQVGILPGGELNQPDSVAHSPPSDHPAGDPRRLLDVTFGSGRFSPLAVFLPSACSQHSIH